MPVIPTIWEARIGGLLSEDSPRQKHKILYEKNPLKAKDWGHVSNICETQSSGPSTYTKKIWQD
jgi:hypothetical protein